MPRRLLAAALLAIMAVASCGGSASPGPVAPEPPDPDPPGLTGIEGIVDSVRVAFGLPALVGAIVTRDNPDFARAVSGYRRAGGGPAATLDDLWHLGSNFKAFTAMLAAIAVEDGEIAWETTIADAFPELAGTIRAEYQAITLRDLLSQQSRLQRDPPARAIVGTTRTEQRDAVAAWALTQPPASASGQYSYTNTGYMVAAAMLERALETSFENAMQTHVFDPLGIDDAGWGPQAGHASSTQPVAHRLVNDQWQVLEAFDNPPVYASAGGAHMSVGSWSRFIQEVLRLENGEPTIVSLASGSATTTPTTPIGGSDYYGMGWVITSRTWASGRTLTHDGTNTANYSVTWVAPERGFAILGLSNSYDSGATARVSTAVDVLMGRLIQYYETVN
ncbi:MAG TPA: serine hydrolase domain-containing protein [Longimicrobiales bacterium]|nr:serine hydrolase domain-containing protein [Longimicrobiales bacterium]